MEYFGEVDPALPFELVLETFAFAGAFLLWIAQKLPNLVRIDRVSESTFRSYVEADNRPSFMRFNHRGTLLAQQRAHSST